MRRMWILISLLMTVTVGCTTADARFVVDEGVRDKLSRLMDQQVTGTSDITKRLDEQTAVLVAIREKLNEPPKTAGGGETPDTSISPSEIAPPADPEPAKPILYYSVTDNCGMCDTLKADIDAGLFSDFDMRLLEDDTWSKGYPVLRWQDESGTWRYLTYSGRHVGYRRSMIPDIKKAMSVKTEGTPVSATPSRMAGPRWNWDGDWNPTEDEARDHLLKEHGVDASGLTLDAMTVIHDNCHNTSFTTSSSCPGGVCPTRPVQQRRGIFRIFR